MAGYGLYLHFPFCRSRCAYCDFVTTTGREEAIPAYCEAVLREAEILSRQAPEPIELETLYLGGGTPSLVPAREVSRLIAGLQAIFPFRSGVEITLEVNPEGAGEKSLRAFRQAGVNRLSLGMQTGHDHLLRRMTRAHSTLDTLAAVEQARLAGFENISLDLIAGLPGQTLQEWQASLMLALDLAPDHLSLYGLTIEPGTGFAKMSRKGLLDIPEGDRQADMLELADEALRGQGYLHYEIANWSLPGRRSAHNLRYWKMKPYLGLGVGAHSFTGTVRSENTSSLDEYLRRIDQESETAGSFPRTPVTDHCRPLDQETLIEETLIMGLRLIEDGVDLEAFRQTFQGFPEDFYPTEIRSLIGAGLLTVENHALRLTRRGWLLGNQVFSRLIQDP